MTRIREARPTRRQAALTLSALAALSLTACGAADAEFEDDSPEADPEDTAPDQPDASDGGGQEPEDQEDQDEEDQDQAAAGGEVIDPSDAVATIDYTLPTDEIDGTMTVGLHHLRRRGQTMELLLTFTPEFSGHEAYSLWDLHGKDHSNVAPALFDRTNLKRYDILSSGTHWDSNRVWNSKQAVHDLASGDTQAYWATYAAPEDDIDTINIAIPGAPEFEDVPIEQASSDDEGTA